MAKKPLIDKSVGKTGNDVKETTTTTTTTTTTRTFENKQARTSSSKRGNSHGPAWGGAGRGAHARLPRTCAPATCPAAEGNKNKKKKKKRRRKTRGGETPAWGHTEARVACLDKPVAEATMMMMMCTESV